MEVSATNRVVSPSQPGAQYLGFFVMKWPYPTWGSGQNCPCCPKDARYCFNFKLNHFVKSHLAQNCTHVNNNNMENEGRKNMTISNARCIQPWICSHQQLCIALLEYSKTLTHISLFLPNFTCFLSQPHFGQVWGWSPTLGKGWRFGVLRDSRMFRARQQGPKHLALRRAWCH